MTDVRTDPPDPERSDLAAALFLLACVSLALIWWAQGWRP
jgi:hypothetical protein